MTNRKLGEFRSSTFFIRPNYIRFAHVKDIPSYSAEDMRQLGFRARNAKTPWSAYEERLLQQFFDRLVAGEEEIHTKNTFYYIAHHILSRSKTEGEVKRKILMLRTQQQSQLGKTHIK
jgi:hypothetical protein